MTDSTVVAFLLNRFKDIKAEDMPPVLDINIEMHLEGIKPITSAQWLETYWTKLAQEKGVPKLSGVERAKNIPKRSNPEKRTDELWDGWD